MKTITLPDDLNINTPFSIQVYEYESTQDLSKQQIVLNQNVFSFLQEGTKEVFFDNTSNTINNSQFLLMKSGHCLMTEKISTLHKQYRSVLFMFSNDAVIQFIRKFNLNASKHHKYYSAYSFTYTSFVKNFVVSILDISKFPNAIQNPILETKFEEIMLYLIEFKGIDFLYSLIGNTTNETQQFIQIIESNKLNKLTIKELSFLCNMSVSTFKRNFKKQFKTTPSKWFQNKRLEHAANLLKENSKRPSDIFDQVGYENLSNFIYAFKTKYGITPKQFQSN